MSEVPETKLGGDELANDSGVLDSPKLDEFDQNDEIVGRLAPVAKPKEKEKKEGKNWYILKVQVNREDTVRKNLENRARIAGLDKYFGEILVPTEKVKEIRNGKPKDVTRKLYPGYLMVNMEINDETWYLVRGTSGVGDFTGTQGEPTPMLPHEVQRILKAKEELPHKEAELKVGYSVGQTVKVKEGPFETLEGVVDNIDHSSGRVSIILSIFGRSTPVELEYWQLEQSAE